MGGVYFKMNVKDTEFGDVNWIHLAQDRDQWRALVNTVMKMWGIC
jgi:hypothetical protein